MQVGCGTLYESVDGTMQAPDPDVRPKKASSAMTTVRALPPAPELEVGVVGSVLVRIQANVDED